jgi:hypothetical protein
MSLPPVTEKQFQAQVMDLARLLGWGPIYHSWISIRSAPGFPDVVLLRPPRCIFAELKTEHGRVNVAQHQWLDALRDCPGVEVFVWRPSDLPTIAELLR